MPPPGTELQGTTAEIALRPGNVGVGGSTRSQLAWRLARRAALLVGLFTLVVGLGLTFVVARHVELPFVRNLVNAAIERALGEGYSSTTASAAMSFDPVLGLVVRLRGISVTDALDHQVARVPSAMLAVSPVALISSRDLIRSVEVDDPWLSIRREGGVAILGTGETPLPGQVQPAAAPYPNGLDIIAHPIEAIDASLEGILALADRGFDRVSLYNATVELWREGETEAHIFRRADLRIDANRDTGRLSATLTGSGYSSRWSVSAERMANPLTGGGTLSLMFSQVTLTDLFAALGGGQSSVTSDIPLYGRMIVGTDSAGHVSGATATLNLGSGYVAFGPKADPISLDLATLRFAWDVAAETIYLEPSPFVFGEGGATMSGTLRPDGNGRFAFDFSSTDAVLAPRDSPAPPLPVDLLRLAGRLDLGERLIHVDTATISSATGTLSAAGSIGLEPGGSSLALVANIGQMPLTTFEQMWPPGVADSARRWVLKSITGGTVSGTLDAAVPAGILGTGIEPTADMVNLRLNLAGVSFHSFDGFPDVTAADGVAVLSGSRFAVDLDRATIVTSTGDALDVTAATFAVTKAGDVPTGRIEMQANGPAAAFGAIADLPPMAALQPFGIPPSALHGDGGAVISASWPLVAGIAAGEVQWRVGLTLNGFGSDAPFKGRHIDNGDVFLDVTPAIVTIAGTASVDGVPANVDLALPLTSEVEGRQELRMVLDDDARARLGLQLDYILGGTVSAFVSDLGEGAGQHYDLDLAQARVNLAPVGWSKPVGVPATMSFDVVPVEGGQEVRNLVVQGDGFGFVGEVYLDEHSTIVGADIRDFHLRPADSLHFTVERVGNGWVVDAAGEAFDARGLLTQGMGTLDPNEGPSTDITIHARFDRLIGFNDEHIDNADFDYVSTNGDVALLSLTGTLDGSPLTAVIDSTGGTTVALHIADAGALLRFTNIYSRIHGGELSIAGAAQPDESIAGHVAMTGFAVVDEPGLTRLMAPPPGTPAELATTVPFEGLEFDFVERGLLFTIADALLRGGNMGAVGDGWIDLGAGEIRLSGTYIPAYVVNNIFARIPIVGLALGGGQREGLIGLTFQIAGPLDNAVMEINPLSLIAPGIFRKLFQFP